MEEVTAKLQELESRLSKVETIEVPKLIGQSIVNISSTGVNTASSIELGKLATGNRYSYIDLIGDDTYTDYGGRLMRNNNGPNSNTVLSHRGLGAILLEVIEPGGSIYTTINGVNKTITLANTNTWNALVLLNSWLNYGLGWSDARYTKNPDGYVKVTGLIKSGIILAGTVIGTLPAGFRPTTHCLFTGLFYDGVKETAYRLEVRNSGDILISSVTNSSYLSLESIWFPTF